MSNTLKEYGKLVSELSEIHQTHLECVADELHEFIRQVKRKLRGVKFAFRENSVSVWVFYPNDLYALGWIAFADYRESGDMGDCYVVGSRNITNEKYANYSHQHHMKMSGNLDVAVKNALKHLRPWSIAEIALSVHRSAKTAIDHARRRLNEPLFDLHKKIFDATAYTVAQCHSLAPYKQELLAFAERDVDFVDQNLKSDLLEFIKARKEIEELYNLDQMSRGDASLSDAKYRVNIFVYVHEDMHGRQRVSTIPCVLSSRWADSHSFIKSEVHTYFSESEVPEDIMSKLAVLQLNQRTPEGDLNYVINVGVNHGNGCFHVSTDRFVNSDDLDDRGV